MRIKSEPYVLVIDGCDVAGKETFSKELTGEITKAGYKVKVVSLPDYGNISGKLIRKLLMTKNLTATKMEELATLFEENRVEVHEALAKEVLDVIIFDRYATANFLLGTCSLERCFAELNKLEAEYCSIDQLLLFGHRTSDDLKYHSKLIDMKKDKDRNETLAVQIVTSKRCVTLAQNFPTSMFLSISEMILDNNKRSYVKSSIHSAIYRYFKGRVVPSKVNIIADHNGEWFEVLKTGKDFNRVAIVQDGLVLYRPFNIKPITDDTESLLVANTTKIKKAFTIINNTEEEKDKK
jgi:thymidylate kinase